MNVSNNCGRTCWYWSPDIFIYIYIWLVPESVWIKPPSTNSSTPPLYVPHVSFKFPRLHEDRRSLAASGDINDLLRVIDTNSNGVVEYEEFLSKQNAMNMCSVISIYIIWIILHVFSPSTNCGVFDLVYSESLDDSHTVVLLFLQKHGDIICFRNPYCWNGG